MSKYDLQQLRERLAERYDPDYLVDILGITSEELLDAFPHLLMAKALAGEFSEVLDAE